MASYNSHLNSDLDPDFVDEQIAALKGGDHFFIPEIESAFKAGFEYALQKLEEDTAFHIIDCTIQKCKKLNQAADAAGGYHFILHWQKFTSKEDMQKELMERIQFFMNTSLCTEINCYMLLKIMEYTKDTLTTVFQEKYNLYKILKKHSEHHWDVLEVFATLMTASISKHTYIDRVSIFVNEIFSTYGKDIYDRLTDFKEDETIIGMYFDIYHDKCVEDTGAYIAEATEASDDTDECLCPYCTCESILSMLENITTSQ
jgi:hypothetical protein